MVNENIVILYHKNCLDGFGAAYAAWRFLGDSAAYIPVTYGEEPPYLKDKSVFILDFSYPRATILDIKRQADTLLILDHHKTAQEALSGLDYAVFDMGKSGCRLAWEYFHPSKSIPRLLELIEDRDLWKFRYEETKAVTAALFDLWPTEFNHWDTLVKDEDELNKLFFRGKDLCLINTREVEKAFNVKHKVTLNGVQGLAANASPKISSELGNRLATESGTFGLVYSYDGAKNDWMCSLRSVGSFDVSELAKIYGGGGHRNASGMRLSSSELFIIVDGCI